MRVLVLVLLCGCIGCSPTYSTYTGVSEVSPNNAKPLPQLELLSPTKYVEDALENYEQEQNRRLERIKRLPLSGQQKKDIMEGKIWIGASPEAAELAWGKPKTINRTTTKYGTREQWVYEYGNYLYIFDGKVETMQN